MGMGIEIRNKMAKRAAQEIKDGMVVNLGIGIPSLIPNHLPKDIRVVFHAENGIIGMGPSPRKGEEDANLCNAGGFPVTIQDFASYCDSTIAFGMVRRGYLDMTVLGSLQVSQFGDIANWIVPGKKIPGMGGAMELAQKANRVIVVMNHVDKQGQPKILESCTLPQTARGCADLIITDMAVFQVTSEGLQLKEVFEPHCLAEIKKLTGCRFRY
ncbi:3-oxoacid CoA-transferase subunit B [Cytobacillus sp. Hz8]|uniref:3-oxoacid CoA-transferase subunit B n=1 Tax=Cytobacillus sp. Hz8 TaxID=3347168 RepID=UPI0035DCAEF2